MLFEGGELIVINKGRYDRVDDGSVHIGAGPFVTALEYAAGVEATVVGKPSKNFFHSALAGTCVISPRTPGDGLSPLSLWRPQSAAAPPSSSPRRPRRHPAASTQTSAS